MEGYSLVNEFRIKQVKVQEYKSLRSGLKVFLLEYDTPIVNSYFVLPTIADTNEGLPHILEHLIFLGSEDYPYRGTLDMLACRALSIGTNAWTCVDHTAYTLSTAGIEGTLRILPIYLDHILNPTLTQEAFVTDVHHVTIDGTSSGVVYCEMKSSENTADSLMHFEVMDKLYPGSGYSMNTGGRLDAIRSTNLDRVRQYHKMFYRLDNLSIIICGDVSDSKSIFTSISNAELTHLLKLKSNPKMIKLDHTALHWDDPKHVQELHETVKSTVYFPNEEEDNGNYSMNWRGPKWDEFEAIRSISLMGSYLVDSTTSPLEKALIHNNDHFGSCVDFSLDCFKEIYFQLSIRDVPFRDSQKMHLVEDKLKSTLDEVYKSPLDMNRLKMLITRSHMNYLRQIETSPHETLVESIISYILYSNEPRHLKSLLCTDDIVESLLLKDETYWKNVLYRYFIQPNYVSVKCIPSIKRANEIQEFEKELITQQLKEYSREALEKNKEMVESVKNNAPPPELINSFPFCDASKVVLPNWPVFRNFTTSSDDGNMMVYNNSGKNCLKDADEITNKLHVIPFPMQLNHISSDFVRVYMLFSTFNLKLTLQEKKLLSLLCVLLFECNVYIEGKLFKSEEFIKLLMDNTTAYGANLGLSNSSLLPDSYCDFVTVFLTSAVADYNKVLDIFHNVLYNIEYPKDVIKNHINSLLTSFSKKKRSAKCLNKQLAAVLRFKSNSIRVICGLGQQDVFLKSVMNADLSSSLLKLHKKIFKPENLCVHITADLTKLPRTFLEFWRGLECTSKISRTLTDHFSFEYGRDRDQKAISGVISSLASTDVSYFTLIIQAPIGFNNPDFYAINVITEYLSIAEGPLYRLIRGGGYAYHFNVLYYPSQGEIHLIISQSTDLVNALKATQDAINKFISSTTPVDDIMAAKASLIFKILSNEETLSDYSQETFISSLRQTRIDHNREFVNKVEAISVDEIKRVAQCYLNDLLSFEGPPKTISCITSKNTIKDISRELNGLKYNNLSEMNSKQLLSLLSNVN